MKGFTVIILFLITMATFSCNECTSCEPFTEEPYLEIRFLNKADSSNLVIVIDSVNQVYAGDLRHFADTTYVFKFPLDMHHDTSVFQIVYRDTTDIDTKLTNEIRLIYRRQFIRRDDNYIIVECNLEELITDFFDAKLNCKDNATIECISNEATANIYN